MALEEQDKSEQATPFKLQEARRRGQVVKSTEITTLVLLGGFTVMFMATGLRLAHVFVTRTRSILLSAGNTRIDAPHWLQNAVTPLLFAISPLLIVLVGLAILANVAQMGPVFSSDPLKPDFTRLNPVTGLKRLFTLRIAFELFKAVCKLGIVTLVMYFGAAYYLEHLPGYASLNPARVPFVTSHLIGLVVFLLLGLYLIVSAIDFLFSRFEFSKKMRMSRRELKDEYRKREGDPEVRSRRRRLQQELAKRTRATQRVKDADLVLVNPTHYAIALRYRPENMPAPMILAMGAGHLAARIRTLAARHSIPVVRNPRLARSLYKLCVLNGYIPESSYADVAPLYRWLRALKMNRQITAAGPGQTQ